MPSQPLLVFNYAHGMTEQPPPPGDLPTARDQEQRAADAPPPPRVLLAPGSEPLAMLVRRGFQLKVPKGTKDWEGKDMVIRDKIFSTITNVFKRHGAVTIDT